MRLPLLVATSLLVAILGPGVLADDLPVDEQGYFDREPPPDQCVGFLEDEWWFSPGFLADTNERAPNVYQWKAHFTREYLFIAEKYEFGYWYGYLTWAGCLHVDCLREELLPLATVPDLEAIKECLFGSDEAGNNGP